MHAKVRAARAPLLAFPAGVGRCRDAADGQRVRRGARARGCGHLHLRRPTAPFARTAHGSHRLVVMLETPARLFHTVRSQPSTVRQRRSQWRGCPELPAPSSTLWLQGENTERHPLGTTRYDGCKQHAMRLRTSQVGKKRPCVGSPHITSPLTTQGVSPPGSSILVKGATRSARFISRGLRSPE